MNTKQPLYLALDFDGVAYTQTETHLAEWRKASVNALLHLIEGRPATEEELKELTSVAQISYQQHGASTYLLKRHFRVASSPEFDRALWQKVHEEFDITTLQPDPELAQKLKDYGLDKVAFVTNGSNLHLKRGITQLFGNVLEEQKIRFALDSAEVNFVSKEDSPAAYMQVPIALKVKPQQVLVVEDNAKCAEQALRAGFKVAMIGKACGDLPVFKSLHDVLDRIPRQVCHTI